MQKRTKNIIMVVAAIVIMVGLCVFPLMTIKDSEFGGADGAAGDLILEIDKDFVPWAESIWAPPGGETESLMFCLQAALGSGIFCFCAGYLVAAKKYKNAQKPDQK